MQTLIDLGERRILQSIIPRFAVGTGDDSAAIPLPVGVLVATTDPVPPPAAASIGKDDDPFWMGWLLVTINVSDLAAAGALPLAFLSAIECEATREVAQFERLLEGTKSACEDAKIAYVGGNIREAQRLSAVGVALGLCNPYKPLGRAGAKSGDTVFSIGLGGIFWRDALRVLDGRGQVEKERSPLYKPRSQIAIMHRLAAQGWVRAAMDNSDGLLPTLTELSAKSGFGIEIDTELLRVPDLADEEKVNQTRMWLGWGDWNVIACVGAENVEYVLQFSRENRAPIVRIGTVVNEKPGVVLIRGQNRLSAPRLESERFAADSWMLKGIGEYVRMLRNVELP
jgi:thiamine-monophosphate kinase